MSDTDLHRSLVERADPATGIHIGRGLIAAATLVLLLLAASFAAGYYFGRYRSAAPYPHPSRASTGIILPGTSSAVTITPSRI